MSIYIYIKHIIPQSKEKLYAPSYKEILKEKAIQKSFILLQRQVYSQEMKESRNAITS